MREQDPLTGEILNALRSLVQALTSASRISESAFGLSGAQMYVLQQLRHAGTLTINEIATLTHTHQSTVSVVVSKLVTKGLVARVRSEQDARIQMVSLTPTGKATLRHAPLSIQDRLVDALSGFTGSDRKKLAALLKTMLENAGLEAHAPAMFLEKSSVSKK